MRKIAGGRVGSPGSKTKQDQERAAPKERSGRAANPLTDHQVAERTRRSLVVGPQAPDSGVNPGYQNPACVGGLEYYSVLEGKEIQAPATTPMTLGEVILGEVRHRRTRSVCMIPLAYGTQSRRV